MINEMVVRNMCICKNNCRISTHRKCILLACLYNSYRFILQKNIGISKRVTTVSFSLRFCIAQDTVSKIFSWVTYRNMSLHTEILAENFRKIRLTLSVSIRKGTRPYNPFKQKKFLSVQYRISFPNGWKHQWHQESKRHLDWSVWDVAEGWSSSNEFGAHYALQEDGSCRFFLSNIGHQVNLPFKYWENENFSSRSENTTFDSSKTGARCFSGQEIRYGVHFVLLCHMRYVVLVLI